MRSIMPYVGCAGCKLFPGQRTHCLLLVHIDKCDTLYRTLMDMLKKLIFEASLPHKKGFIETQR